MPAFSLTFAPVIAGCSCHPAGVNATACPAGQGACLCDPDTGTCPCLPNVTGWTCDHCADGYWNLIPGRGCQPCDCDPRTSNSSHCDQARKLLKSSCVFPVPVPYEHFFKECCSLRVGMVLETKVWAPGDHACFTRSRLLLTPATTTHG